MGIKLLTLNIENDRHLARAHAALAKHLPDIVCLQEVIESDCAYLASSGGYDVKYALSGRLPTAAGPERNWGAAVLSRVPVRHQEPFRFMADAKASFPRVSSARTTPSKSRR